MPAPIWILAETWRGQIPDSTLELLALGREVASQLGAPLEAVLIARQARTLAAPLGAADLVLSAELGDSAELAPEASATILARLVQERQPQAVLLSWTNLSMDLGALAAARSAAPLVGACKDLKADAGTLVAQCVVYGGKLEATVAAITTPAFFGVLPGARSAEAGRAQRPPTIAEVTLEAAEARVTFQRYLEPEGGDVDITREAVLVGVGRGIQTQANMELAEELAAVLGGAVCGSRPVIDQGWLPLSRQVGKSGMQIQPKLYLMLGISGAPEHVEGMKAAQLVIACNTDASAPVFNVAHYGVVGDALELAPALTEAIRTRKG